MISICDLADGDEVSLPIRKRPSSKEKDILHIPDMFLTKAEREEKRRRLQPSAPVIDISIEETPILKKDTNPPETKLPKPQTSKSTFFQKVSVRKQKL